MSDRTDQDACYTSRAQSLVGSHIEQATVMEDGSAAWVRLPLRRPTGARCQIDLGVQGSLHDEASRVLRPAPTATP
jgi:hypothetical protein